MELAGLKLTWLVSGPPPVYVHWLARVKSLPEVEQAWERLQRLQIEHHEPGPVSCLTGSAAASSNFVPSPLRLASAQSHKLPLPGCLECAILAPIQLDARVHEPDPRNGTRASGAVAAEGCVGTHWKPPGAAAAAAQVAASSVAA